jgi:hypothetical protein
VGERSYLLRGIIEVDLSKDVIYVSQVVSLETVWKTGDGLRESDDGFRQRRREVP